MRTAPRSGRLLGTEGATKNHGQKNAKPYANSSNRTAVRRLPGIRGKDFSVRGLGLCRSRVDLGMLQGWRRWTGLEVKVFFGFSWGLGG